MPWRGKDGIIEAKDRVKKLDRERQFVDRHRGQVVPKLNDMKMGEAREFGLVVLHVDMNNFKGLTGDLDNEKKLRFLNVYLSELTHIIRDFDGFIEKYVGDSITALFGVGKDKTDAVDDGVSCAVTILTEIYYVINVYFKKIGLPKFSCSIGLDYGNIWIARVGVQGMNQLTLVGNEVSIAKQLEEFSGNHELFLGGSAYGGLSTKRKSFCHLQSSRSDFTWTWKNGEKYPFYRYSGRWTGYSV